MTNKVNDIWELYSKPYKQIAYNTPKPKQEWVQLELDLADTINYHGDIEVTKPEEEITNE